MYKCYGEANFFFHAKMSLKKAEKRTSMTVYDHESSNFEPS